MSKKKKLPKNIREQRRLQQAEIASGRVNYVISEMPKNAVINATTDQSISNKDLKYSLPIKAIKTDLVKNGILYCFHNCCINTAKTWKCRFGCSC